MTRVIVFGNAKGGTGKSTLAIHTIVGLLHQGKRVAAIDLDPAQGSLTRHIENRKALHPALPSPFTLPLPPDATPEAALEAIGKAAAEADILVLDTPGSDTALTRLGHGLADTLVTPLNDSFLDLDVLARVDPQSRKILRPSTYSEMVWKARQDRFRKDRGQIDWIVLRNRLAQLGTRNARAMEGVLADLAGRIRFRQAPGLSERVIFRELFLNGLTLHDLGEAGVQLTMSHVAARQELRNLQDAMGF